MKNRSENITESLNRFSFRNSESNQHLTSSVEVAGHEMGGSDRGPAGTRRRPAERDFRGGRGFRGAGGCLFLARGAHGARLALEPPVGAGRSRNAAPSLVQPF